MKAIPYIAPFINRRLPLFERILQTEHTYQCGIGFDWNLVRDGAMNAFRCFISTPLRIGLLSLRPMYQLRQAYAAWCLWSVEASGLPLGLGLRFRSVPSLAHLLCRVVPFLMVRGSAPPTEGQYPRTARFEMV